MNSTFLRRATALTATATFALALTACSDGGDDEPAAAVHTADNGDVYNDVDVEFATGMIPHHAQAIQMSLMAQGRPLDPEVETLVEEIREAQTPEVETMSDWLTAWDQEVPETAIDHANAGHAVDPDDLAGMAAEEAEGSHGSGAGHDMPGMVSAEDLAALGDAPDAEFQDMWLELMIEHHEGAIEMAETEQAEGEYAAAVDLAESIATSQADEIDTMERLLG
jgi:uncharacterized protein (DUF305 family)